MRAGEQSSAKNLERISERELSPNSQTESNGSSAMRTFKKQKTEYLELKEPSPSSHLKLGFSSKVKELDTAMRRRDNEYIRRKEADFFDWEKDDEEIRAEFRRLHAKSKPKSEERWMGHD